MRAPEPSAPSPAALLLRTVLLGAWLGSAALVVQDVVLGRPAFLGCGLVGSVTAVAVALGDRLGLDLPQRPAGEPSLRVYAVGSVVRSSAWLLYAWQARRGPLPLPAVGDLALVAQALGMFAGTLLVTPNWNLLRSLRLGLDSVIASTGALLAAWVTLIGPRTGYDLTAPGVAVGLAVLFVLLLEVFSVVLVVVREVVHQTVSSIVSVVLVAVAEAGTVVTAFAGGRTVHGVVALGWVLAWALLWRGMLWNQTVPTELVPTDVAQRREVRSTDVATAIVVVSAFVAVLAALNGDGRHVPGGRGTAAIVLAGVAVFAARESLLGRLRATLTSRLRDQAELDPLTGLANRRGLTARLRLVPPDAEWSVLALDLDGFKGVNDVHGHAAGDAVLVTVADVLRRMCPPNGVAARTGGDEFAVLTPGDLTHGRGLATAIADAVRDELAVLGLGPRITLSVGVGRVGRDQQRGPVPEDHRTDRLVAVVEAAAALRSAKELGRDRVQVYPGAVARQRERSLLVEARLREALAAGRVGSVAQPIVDLGSGVVVAAEALARWDDELLGRVPPSEFVVVAERTGLIGELGRAVLRVSATAYAEQGLVGSGVRLAVNASPLELRLPGYVEALAATLSETGLAARDVVVEVTEAVVVEADDPAVRVLGRLADLGVRVVIDDFGTGYSALGYLRRLPVEAMKVDRSLVTEALTSVRTRHIVAGVVDLAHRLGLGVTLEGIEDAASARLAHELGAHQGQGFALGRPAPWTALAERVRGDAGLVGDLTG